MRSWGKRAAMVACAAAVSACTSGAEAPWETQGKLHREFNGRPMNEFVHTYGSAQEEIEVEGGGRIYRWVRVSANAIAPTCEVRLMTDKSEVIRKITVSFDSMGNYTASRCSELFATPSLI